MATTYSIEANIIKNINQLNKLYYDCLDNKCSSTDASYVQWNALITTVNEDIGKLKTKLPPTPGSNNNIIQYTEIINKHKEIQDMRTQMQNKIDDIKNTGTVSQTSNILLQADTALYANLGWSLLATTVLYYVFMKISK